MSAAAELLRGVTRVASPPQIFAKVEGLLADPHSSIPDFARVIEEDAGLTARLLRLANSPFYGRMMRIATVQGAVSMIGNRQLRELVLACTVMRVFKDMPGDVLDMEMFWRHSVACAVMARAIAGLRGDPNVERCFVAGLLHDVGRLVLLMERPRSMAKAIAAAREGSLMLHEAERDEFGFDHAEVGALLMAAWKVPAQLVESIAFHHAPHHAHTHASDASLLHVADLMLNAIALGFSGQHLVPVLNVPAWDSLDLPADQLPLLFGTLNEQYQEAIAFVMGV